MPGLDKLSEFVALCAQHITGNEKGQAQIFLDRLFQASGQPSTLDTTVLPAKSLHDYKFWPHVGRVDNVFGDRNPALPRRLAWRVRPLQQRL